jgi:two-component system OmpR family sensor kinase
MFDSVRVRLALWYVSVLALVLLAFSISVYLLIAQTLYERLDADLHLSLESAAVVLVDGVAAHDGEHDAVIGALNELSTLDSSAVFSATGELLGEQPAQGDVHVELPPLEAIPGAEAYFTTVNSGAGQRRLIAERINVPSKTGRYIIVISRSFESVSKGLQRIRRILYLAIPGALLFSAAGGWFLSRRSLASVVSMSEQARRISAENLNDRLPVANPRDELGRLAGTFNELLARLDGSFTQQRRFMADASHELRTPLSVIRTSAEVTLERENRTENEYRDALKIIDEQARRLSHIVEDMFTLARADVGRRTLSETDFYLDELVMEAARAAGILSDCKNIRVEVSAAEEIVYYGDEGLLRQMLLNLLDNAVKYTNPGGRVNVELQRSNSSLTIAVSDSGIGIPANERALIFERFYRIDKARSGAEHADIRGTGLGLSIARWIAEAHGGQLSLQASGPNGSTFVATLPLQNGQ